MVVKKAFLSFYRSFLSICCSNTILYFVLCLITIVLIQNAICGESSKSISSIEQEQTYTNPNQNIQSRKIRGSKLLSPSQSGSVSQQMKIYHQIEQERTRSQKLEKRMKLIQEEEYLTSEINRLENERNQSAILRPSQVSKMNLSIIKLRKQKDLIRNEIDQIKM